MTKQPFKRVVEFSDTKEELLRLHALLAQALAENEYLRKQGRLWSDHFLRRHGINCPFEYWAFKEPPDEALNIYE